jgi:hypothetical protein
MFASLDHISLNVLGTFSISQQRLCKHTQHGRVNQLVQTWNWYTIRQPGNWLVLSCTICFLCAITRLFIVSRYSWHSWHSIICKDRAVMMSFPKL